MNGEYTIFRRDRSTGIRSTLIERYTEFQLTLNWGEISKFTISGKTTGAVELEPGDGILFYRNNELILSGIVDKVTASCDDVSAGLKSWTAEGCDDSVIFSRYQAFADPTEITFANGVVDKVSGYAWNRMIYYIRRNMGSDALAGRKISGLTLPAAANVGLSTESACRYKGLDEVLREIGAETDDDGVANELYPRFIWNPDTGAMSVTIPVQRDLTGSIIIAPEFGNLLNWSRTETAPTCNAVWVVSGDHDADGTQVRLWVYEEDAESIARYGRVEKIVTKSDIRVTENDPETEEDESVTAGEVYELLENEARKTLTDGAYRMKFSGTMVETPELRFMTDWKCGDLISCVVDGQKFPTTIRTVAVSYADRFEKVTPTLGENERGIFSEIFARLRGLDTRMDTEELS